MKIFVRRSFVYHVCYIRVGCVLYTIVVSCFGVSVNVVLCTSLLYPISVYIYVGCVYEARMHRVFFSLEGVLLCRGCYVSLLHISEKAGD